MTPQEQAIWNATYAAAFAASFESARRSVGYDAAVKLESAELPIAIADLAIRELRRWCDQEKPSTGITVE